MATRLSSDPPSYPATQVIEDMKLAFPTNHGWSTSAMGGMTPPLGFRGRCQEGTRSRGGGGGRPAPATASLACGTPPGPSRTTTGPLFGARGVLWSSGLSDRLYAMGDLFASSFLGWRQGL